MTKAAFKSRAREWANKLDLSISTIIVRPMKRKWASCSTNGILSFNIECLELEQDLCDYVIIHELLHIAVPNHGRLWKSLMIAHLGDYKSLEQRLSRIATNHLGMQA